MPINECCMKVKHLEKTVGVQEPINHFFVATVPQNMCVCGLQLVSEFLEDESNKRWLGALEIRT